MYSSANGANDADGLVFLFRVVARKTAYVLCALDVINSVALAVWVLVGQMVWKHLLVEDVFAVIAFNRHPNVNSLFDLSVERAFFVKTHVDLDVRHRTRKALVGTIG